MNFGSQQAMHMMYHQGAVVNPQTTTTMRANSFDRLAKPQINFHQDYFAKGPTPNNGVNSEAGSGHAAQPQEIDS